jgi:hypothetical protein
MRVQILCFVGLIVMFSSCTGLQNVAKYELADGKYTLKMDSKKYDCYVENNQDSIIIYKLPSKISTSYPNQMDVFLPAKQRLVKSSLDIDILTALFKIRPQVNNVLPTQLNANFNGNIYVGYRTDIYQIFYEKNPLDVYQRKINHFGFSGGLFVGLGNTAMNPSTTNNAIATEYDGITFQKGIAGIVAINKLTIGVSVGLDNLLSSDRKDWIYDNKPWVGLMLGLNLN